MTDTSSNKKKHLALLAKLKKIIVEQKITTGDENPYLSMKKLFICPFM